MGRKHNPETRKKLSKVIKEWYASLTPEEKEKRRKKLKEAHSRPEVRKKHREATKEHWASLTPEEKEKQSERVKEVANRPEERKRRSEAATEQWASLSLEEKRRILQPAHDAQSFISKPELELYSQIKEHYPTAKNSQWIAGYQMDIVLSEHKINIEYDGEYWHQDPEKDAKRDRVLQKLGWKVLRVREGEEFSIVRLHALVKGSQSEQCEVA